MSGTQRTSGQGNPGKPLNPQSQSASQQAPVQRRDVDAFSRHMENNKQHTASKKPPAVPGEMKQKTQPRQDVPDNVFMVNNLVNRNFRYVSDSRQFQTTDYWQTPDEMKKNMSGDCEDFALLKYQILQERGVNEDQLSLAYGKLNGEGHLITLYKDKEGNEHVLDNASKDIQTVEEREDLRVLVRFKMSDVSYGEDGWLKVLAKIRSNSN